MPQDEGYKDYKLLSNINSPKDLKKLRVEQLPQLCEELRLFLLQTLSVNPGHLGSNLGAIEMTVAMHYVFDTPNDRIVWDVGHQAYCHKILTGRKDKFYTLRQWGGLSGFPSPSESEYDTFAAGHASNSISAALGMAVAIALKNENKNVIAFLGDGSMTGGMAFEGLNNTSSFPNNLLVILNDNNMSIDKNVGGLNKYLVNLITSPAYNNIRNEVYKGLKKLHIVNDSNKQQIIKLNNRVKTFMTQQKSTFFDGFCIRYFGPIDGNDVIRAVNVLQDIKNFKGPKILHVSTIKGKGYKPAEKDPIVWHAPGNFDVQSGERTIQSKKKIEPLKFQDVFGYTLVELAKMDKRIVGVTPAMPTGCSMTYMMKEFPNRTYDVGIAEGHAVTFSSGMACEGMIPFCNIYSTFMQRAYDQIIHDVALNNNHVIFCLDRAGLVGEDGATHQGSFDLAYLSTIPNITICAPIDEVELRNMMYSAYKYWSGPIAIRYPRGKGFVIDWHQPFKSINIGKGVKLSEGSQIAILSIGIVGKRVQQAILELEDNKDKIAHYDLRFAKPIDKELISEVFSKYNKVITIEEGTIKGGVGSEIAAMASEEKKRIIVKRLGLPDKFIHHGSVEEQSKYCGIDIQGIKREIKMLLKA